MDSLHAMMQCLICLPPLTSFLTDVSLQAYHVFLLEYVPMSTAPIRPSLLLPPFGSSLTLLLPGGVDT